MNPTTYRPESHVTDTNEQPALGVPCVTCDGTGRVEYVDRPARPDGLPSEWTDSCLECRGTGNAAFHHGWSF